MRLASLCLGLVSLAFAALGQMTPGVVVQKGEPFPIVADFNRDGLDDLIQERNVILSDGNSLADVRDLGLPDGERVAAVADLNGDGRLALIGEVQAMPTPGGGTTAGGPRYTVYLPDRNGHYVAVAGIPNMGPPPKVADVDGDGKEDLLVFTPVFEGVRETRCDVTIYRSLGNGTFDKLPSFALPPDPQVFDDPRILAGDLDHDGIVDLVIRCPQDLIILHGTGGGNFTIEKRFLPAWALGFGTWCTRLADVDGDGNLDILIAGPRTIRTFYGDGKGHFPRMTLTKIEKQHGLGGNLPFPLSGTPDLDQSNNPRDISIGHFTRADRTEIAAGTPEGDIVVFAYDQGVLAEVSRTQTEFWCVAMRAGNFDHSGLNDLYAMGTLIWGDTMPRPRLFVGTEALGASAPILRSPGRHRVSAPPSDAIPPVRLRVVAHADCYTDTTQHVVLLREGAFGRSGDGKTEAVFAEELIHLRIPVPDAIAPAVAALAPQPDGSYAANGFTLVNTPCGSQTVTLTANVE